MTRMPLLAVVIYIATRLALDGEVVDESLLKLFARAGLHFVSRELADDGTGALFDDEGAPHDDAVVS